MTVRMFWGEQRGKAKGEKERVRKESVLGRKRGMFGKGIKEERRKKCLLKEWKRKEERVKRGRRRRMFARKGKEKREVLAEARKERVNRYLSLSLSLCDKCINTP